MSLPDDDIRFLDELARERGASRSAVLQQAVALLRSRQLGHDYASAWDEWDQGDGPIWDVTVGDGIGRG